MADDAAPHGDVEPIRELLRVLADQARFLVSTRGRLQRQLAAACLARCRSLLEAMLTLRDARQDDVAGVLRRCLVEHYLLGRYLLKEPESMDLLIALAEVDYKETIAALSEQGQEPDAELQAWRREIDARKEAQQKRAAHAETAGAEQALPSVRKLPWVQMATKLGVLAVYTNIYRRESTHGGHAGYIGLLGYLTLDPAELTDCLKNPGDLCPWSLWECGILTGQLGLEVNADFALIKEEQQRVVAAFDAVRQAHPKRDELDGHDATADDAPLRLGVGEQRDAQ